MEERLIKFARIVEAGSFTRAAAQLRISQPALTTAVKKLERELQAELLIRGGHKLELTAAGAIAYRTAQTLITETQSLETKIRSAAGEKTVLTLGMIDSLAHLLFIEAAYLDQLEQGAHVSLTIDNSSRLLEQVSHNELDIALVVRPSALAASLVTEMIAEEPLILVAPTGLRASVQSDLKQGRLRHFLSYNQASRTHQVITQHFTGAGISLQPAFYSTSPEIMLRMALAGRGAAVLPYLLVKPAILAGTLQPIAINKSPVIRRTIISVRRSGRALTAHTKLLLEHTARELHSLDQEAGGL